MERLVKPKIFDPFERVKEVYSEFESLGQSDTQVALHVGGSFHCGPCKECSDQGEYVPMAGTQEGEDIIYRCKNGHEMKVLWSKRDE